MGNKRSSPRIDWLATGPLAPFVDAYKQYLTERGYAATTFGNCTRSIAHFAQWIRERRLRVHRIDETAVALAEQLEVSRQTVNALETGKYDPSLPLAFRIARLFESRIEDVFLPDEA